MNVLATENDATEYNTLVEAELETLFRVSQVLHRSLELRDILQKVLRLLHDQGRLHSGMVCLVDDQTGELMVAALHKDTPQPLETVRYRPGEGLVGSIMQRAQPLIVERIADEPRYLGRLGVYDTSLPLIGVPIRLTEGEPVGVLTAQPPTGQQLKEQARFLEMVANLIGQTVRVARMVDRERQELEAERDKLKRVVAGEHGFDNIVGHTRVMRNIFEQIRQVAKWNTTVLIRGESGTGKELIANAIHYNSPRVHGSFVKLNCAALPENLLESELFGHEKGAFTGATTQRKGRFEQADGGTLFLDEIGEISPAFQAKLLRILQEGEFERVGGTRTMKVDVRVIAATNRDLEEEVKQGMFREDLYYRLNVMPLYMPPLRDRIEDIPELAHFLVAKLSRQQGRELEVMDSAIRQLMQYDWPGNVRELENCLERAAIMSVNGVIDRDTINLTGLEDRFPSGQVVRHRERVDYTDTDVDERERVIAALEESGWVQAKAARLLGMTPRQIAYRIQTLNIKVRQI